MREKLAEKHIRGRGIEIGGLHCPLPVPHGAKVIYVDRLPPGEAHPDVQTKVKSVVIDDAEKLDKFRMYSLDFIIANHVIEHCHDPIGTLITWSNRLDRDGIIFMAIPEKTQTFDAPRAVTTLQHLIDDHQAGDTIERDREHYREWLRIIDKVQEPALSHRVDACVRDRANIHFHVWDTAAMNEFVRYVSDKLKMEILAFERNGSEVIVVLRKLP